MEFRFLCPLRFHFFVGCWRNTTSRRGRFSCWTLRWAVSTVCPCTYIRNNINLFGSQLRGCYDIRSSKWRMRVITWANSAIIITWHLVNCFITLGAHASGYLREYFNLSDKWQKGWKHYTLRIFKICTRRQMSLRFSNRRGYDGRKSWHAWEKREIYAGFRQENLERGDCPKK